ncbi:YolD-like family protein [Alkalihalobacillus sp. BA299]|uniref:YolD-like family protein n=1 Tax=Alkalihalobacillus sp. BA299 TaxID=2815938 RepID=UPI001ADC4273|nr:YolD-like family protein [Alkalihalobacillus sp. BA299]
MFKDRGIVKWQPAAFLPEHKRMLKEVEKEQNRKPRVELDIQKLEEMNEIVCEAMENNSELCLVYYKNGEHKILIGHIHYLDPIKKEFRVLDKFEEKYILKMRDIIDIRFN